MPKPKTKTISFTEQYTDVYEYLKRHGNASRLICDLVREHMTCETKKPVKTAKLDETEALMQGVSGLL